MRTIKRCAIALIGFLIGALIIILSDTGEDRAGGVVLCAVVTLVALVAASAAAVLERVLRKAVEMKTECDLTVSSATGMPILVHIDVMPAKRKMSVTEVAQKVGITMVNISILKNSRARAIRFSTLEAICKALRCRPGDIPEYRESAD